MSPEPELAKMTDTRGDDPFFARPVLIVAVALVASFFKIGIALTTLGTNDVIAFYEFAKAMETHGLAWTYEHSILFNHPPLVGYFLRGLAWLGHQPFFQQNDLTFPFLLRLPGIVADFCVVLLVLAAVREYPHLRPPRWTLLLFAASPVSIMVSGFHGNTDPILVLFLFLASIMVLRGRPLLCGLFLALSRQVKIIPLLLFPIFFFFWLERRRLGLFVGSFLLGSLLLCAEPLLRSPFSFAKNVLSYGRRQLHLSLRFLHHQLGRFPVVFRLCLDQTERDLRAVGPHSVVNVGGRAICFYIERATPETGPLLRESYTNPRRKRTNE